MKLIVLTLLIGILSGCVTAPTPIDPLLVNITSIDKKINKARIGDIILKEGAYLKYKALQLKEDIKAGGGWQVDLYIPAQALIAESEDKKYEYYFGQNVTTHDSIIGTRYTIGGIKILKAPRESEDPIKLFGVTPQATFSKKEEPVFERTFVNKLADDGYSVKLIFVGRKNNNILFKYIEKGLSKENDDLDFDIEFDNSEHNIFEIKDAAIRIISANSTELTYQVISGFNVSQ